MDTPITTPEALGSAIRAARKQRGLTQAALSERAVISQPALSNIERGKALPSFMTLFRLLAAVGLELAVRDRDAPLPPAPWETE